MSKTWSAQIVMTGETCVYATMDFPISDELYEKIQEAIRNEKPLSSCEFYQELKDIAWDSFDPMEWVEIDMEKPELPEDATEEEIEEYEELLEEYNEEVEAITDSFWSEDLTILDPGDERRFKKLFIGTKINGFAGEGKGTKEFNFETETDEICTSTTLIVHYDENGVITDITDIYCSGLASAGLRESWDECEPDYGALECDLQSELEYYMDDEELD